MWNLEGVSLAIAHSLTETSLREHLLSGWVLEGSERER